MAERLVSVPVQCAEIQEADMFHSRIRRDLRISINDGPLISSKGKADFKGRRHLQRVLIRDEKTVLIDLTKDFKTDTLLSLITEIVDPRRIDYVVVNHMEPDHTGAIKTVTQINPSLRILCTPKAKPMLEHYYGITDGVLAVEDGQTLSIGKRTPLCPRTLWARPETLGTYIPEEKILFSCDAFGSYGALPGIVFDDECHDLDFYKSEALRYYTNIVAKFSKPTLAAINKLADVAVDIICPSHGLIWRKNPGTIIELYRKWAEYEKGRNERA
jgi:flavorubredoxin